MCGRPCAPCVSVRCACVCVASFLFRHSQAAHSVPSIVIVPCVSYCTARPSVGVPPRLYLQKFRQIAQQLTSALFHNAETNLCSFSLLLLSHTLTPHLIHAPCQLTLFSSWPTDPNSVVQETDHAAIESKIGCGQVEELIVQAKDELQLAEKMTQWKPWERLVAPAPSNQWQWP
eukprot:Opistho-1_new@17543